MKRMANKEKGIWSFICVLIFMFSACVMLPIDLNNIRYIILYIAPVFVLMEISYGVKKKPGRLIRWSIPVVIIAGVLIYLLKMEDMAEISQQLNTMAHNYMMEWN